MAIILFPKSVSVVESAGQILGTARIIQLFIVVLSLAKIKKLYNGNALKSDTFCSLNVTATC